MAQAWGLWCGRMGKSRPWGFYLSFLEDRFALEGDRVLEPMTELLGEVLLRPRLVGGALDPDYVEQEKENLISTIETSLNDKRVYAGQQMLRAMCRDDGFGVPRLGEPEDVAAITPGELYRHYRQVLGTSQVELFYAGSAPLEAVAELLRRVLQELPRQTPEPLPFASMGRRGSPVFGRNHGLNTGKAIYGFHHRHYHPGRRFSGTDGPERPVWRGPDQQAVSPRAGEAVPVLLCVLFRLWSQGHPHRVLRH